MPPFFLSLNNDELIMTLESLMNDINAHVKNNKPVHVVTETELAAMACGATLQLPDLRDKRNLRPYIARRKFDTRTPQ